MDLKTLRERGAFVANTPVAREISWTHLDGNGEQVTDSFTVHIIRHSAGSVERIRAEASGNADRLWGPLFLSASLRLGDDASERITYDDACALDPGLAQVLIEAVAAVNRMAGTPAGN